MQPPQRVCKWTDLCICFSCADLACAFPATLARDGPEILLRDRKALRRTLLSPKVRFGSHIKPLTVTLSLISSCYFHLSLLRAPHLHLHLRSRHRLRRHCRRHCRRHSSPTGSHPMRRTTHVSANCSLSRCILYWVKAAELCSCWCSSLAHVEPRRAARKLVSPAASSLSSIAQGWLSYRRTRPLLHQTLLLTY